MKKHFPLVIAGFLMAGIAALLVVPPLFAQGGADAFRPTWVAIETGAQGDEGTEFMGRIDLEGFNAVATGKRTGGYLILEDACWYDYENSQLTFLNEDGVNGSVLYVNVNSIITLTRLDPAFIVTVRKTLQERKKDK